MGKPWWTVSRSRREGTSFGNMKGLCESHICIMRPQFNVCLQQKLSEKVKIFDDPLSEILGAFIITAIARFGIPTWIWLLRTTTLDYTKYIYRIDCTNPKYRINL